MPSDLSGILLETMSNCSTPNLRYWPQRPKSDIQEHIVPFKSSQTYGDGSMQMHNYGNETVLYWMALICLVGPVWWGWEKRPMQRHVVTVLLPEYCLFDSFQL